MAIVGLPTVRRGPSTATHTEAIVFSINLIGAEKSDLLTCLCEASNIDMRHQFINLLAGQQYVLRYAKSQPKTIVPPAQIIIEANLRPKVKLNTANPNMQKQKPHYRMCSLPERITAIIKLALPRLAGIVALLATALVSPAATFFSDFNSGLPAGTAIYGESAIATTGGYTNSGCLLLTSNLVSQSGGFRIDSDLDAGAPVYGFVAQFKAFVGGGNGADGFSFNFASDLPGGTMTEEGAGSGLTVEFDTFANPGADNIGIDIKVAGSEIATNAFTGLRQNAWVDVLVQLHPDGTLDVMYDGNWIYKNFPVSGYLPFPYYNGLFGFGARTGGSYDTHAIDNLSITTVTAQSPFVDFYGPVGRSVRQDSPIQIFLTDLGTVVDTNTIVLKLDGAPLAPTVVTQAPPQTAVLYIPTPLNYFAAGSSHTVSVTFADSTLPTPVTNTLEYGFTVGPAVPNLTNQASPTLVSANHGFNFRISQIDANLGPTIQRAENQLANLLINPSTSLPYVNEATLTTYAETNVINYSTAGAQGDFPTEAANSLPGLPGAFPDTTPSGDTNVAMDVVTYLYLPVGIHTLGVNSSDGFRLTSASNPDLFAAQEMAYDGVRAAADTIITFGVTNAGYYPFRICYFVGGLELVNPTLDNPSLEFFSVDSFGNKILINDTNVAGHIAAYRPAATLPYIRSVSPSPSSSSVPHNSAISAILVDGSIGVQTNTINLWLNGTAVSPTISSNAGITTISYQPASLPLNSSNWVQVAFTDSASNRRTNQWYFIVENVLQQLWIIPPASGSNPTWAKWVTTGSTERGLAYNPKTGHVLLASRSTVAGGPGAKGGIAILDGNTGTILGNLDVSLSTASGVGQYILNMVGVGEDGVIYACNLTISATTVFQMYRWRNESAPQELIWSQNPLGGATRCGDSFRVRGSGAGTRIIASGNSTVSTISTFATTDGTNFTGTAISVSGLGTLPTGGFFRLGLAFGCGDTFYGQATGSPTKYCGFDTPSATGSVLGSYPIVAFDTTLSIGPIGVDLMNQRLIGDETAGGTGTTHSMNLYDLSTFTTSGNNSPIDHKTFATSTGSFGTGSVDFTPDGTRVYTLDTANGVIAFSLSPKVAAPTICAQPKTNIVAGIGAVGFMDVTAIGAPQRYQWRFNPTSPTAPGTAILNATNRTLDIYNVQQTNLGYYSVVISNASLLTSVTSSVAVLDTQMVITNQPANQLAAVGGSATFTVGVSNGVAPYSYQWKFNGTNVGANSSSYTVNNAQVANAGPYYTVVITDALGEVVTSQTASLTVGTLGTGTGLIGDYYSSQAKTLIDPPTLERVDSTVNFVWDVGSPDPSISVDNFTVRWTGLVQPLYSQTYTFYTTTDDGARLWVNGQLLIDKWVDQGGVEWSGTIPLTANQKYDLVMEYYENGGGASAKLSWSSTGQVKQIIPQTQLYPATARVQPTAVVDPTRTQMTISWSGTYTLKTATNIEGPWTPAATSSPFVATIDPNQPQVFFRLVSE